MPPHTQGTVYPPVVYLPTDPPRPAPFVLNAEEAATFLRLEGTAAKNLETLSYYRQNGKLRGRLVGRTIVYLLADLIEFVQHQALDRKA